MLDPMHSSESKLPRGKAYSLMIIQGDTERPIGELRAFNDAQARGFMPKVLAGHPGRLLALKFYLASDGQHLYITPTGVSLTQAGWAPAVTIPQLTYRACVMFARDRSVGFPQTGPHQAHLSDAQLMDMGRTAWAVQKDVELPGGRLEVVDQPLRNIVPTSMEHNILANFGGCCTHDGGGDVFLPVGRITTEQMDAILALQSMGISPQPMTFGTWLKATTATRTRTYSLGRNGRGGICIPDFFVGEVACILREHIKDQVDAAQAAEDKAALVDSLALDEQKG